MHAGRTDAQARISGMEAEAAMLAADCLARLDDRPAARGRAALGRAAGQLNLLRYGIRTEVERLRAEALWVRPGAVGLMGAHDRALFLVGADARLAALERCLQALENAAGFRSAPLYRPSDRPDDAGDHQARAGDRAYHALHRALSGGAQDGTAAHLGAFPDIPMAPSSLLAHLHAARRVAMAMHGAAPRAFLDIGCGGGMTLLFAAQVFAQADGLEYDPGYARTARRLLKRAKATRSRVIQGDGQVFGGYGAYDILYFYRPMRDDAGLRRLERQIVTQAKPGAVLIAPYDQFRQTAIEFGCARIAGAVHVMGLAPREAARIARRATEVGLTLAPLERPTSAAEGYLQPLVTRLQNGGFWQS